VTRRGPWCRASFDRSGGPAQTTSAGGTIGHLRRRPPNARHSLRLWLLQHGNNLIVLLVMGVILTIWLEPPLSAEEYSPRQDVVGVSFCGRYSPFAARMTLNSRWEENDMPQMGAPEQIKPRSLDDYLEIMTKAVFQSGISWRVVESKWPGIQEAFHGFDIEQVADFNEKDLEELGQDTRVIRNHRKLAAIVGNAQRLIDLDREHGSFQKFLRSHGDFDSTLTALRKEFKFLGPTGIYYFLYVVGEEVPPHEEFEEVYRK
jgi:3-methyladenine DNA glycosylase Tag